MNTHSPSDSSRRRSTSPAPSGFSNKRVAEMARVENPPFDAQRSATSAEASGSRSGVATADRLESGRGKRPYK